MEAQRKIQPPVCGNPCWSGSVALEEVLSEARQADSGGTLMPRATETLQGDPGNADSLWVLVYSKTGISETGNRLQVRLDNEMEASDQTPDADRKAREKVFGIKPTAKRPGAIVG
ncbi:hypothetical protein EYF80_050153 [Liparis tanakae]|uniref:Uncharacterized protein n=1 Tax=Liparis tanakae TaxID=230148 RepID=A0A4Z2FEL2_9TELE|nr:hypothetical protein EYF80_050153 [Liparis tanakae]